MNEMIRNELPENLAYVADFIRAVAFTPTELKKENLYLWIASDVSVEYIVNNLLNLKYNQEELDSEIKQIMTEEGVKSLYRNVINRALKLKKSPPVKKLTLNIPTVN